MRRLIRGLIGSVLCLLAYAPDADAQCVREPKEDFVEAAHRCVGWLQHPADTTRIAPAAGNAGLLTIGESAATRNEMFPGVGIIADQFLTAIADIAVDRARKHGLAVVHKRIETGVCTFPPPAGLSTPEPLLPDTCELVKATDLLSLIGQARTLRTTLTKDITRIASTEFSTRFGHLPPVSAPATAAFSLIRRLADDPTFRPGADDVGPIAEAFLNAPWATPSGGTFTPIVPVTPAVATLEVAVSAARVYALAMQMRKEEADTFGERDANARAVGLTPPQPPPTDAIDVIAVIDRQVRLCGLVFPAAPKVPSVCPTDRLGILEWTNLAVRAVARLQSDTPNYRDALRAAVTIMFEATDAIQRASGEPEPVMRVRLATVRWARAIALASTDMDAARIVSAMAEYLGTAVGSSCDENCGSRRKTAALLSGIAAYSLTYVDVPAGATAEQRQTLAQEQQVARRQALESVIDAATDRRHRAGDQVVSIGTGVGAGRRTFQDLAAGRDWNTTLEVPFGVTWQKLPSPGWSKGFPFHVMFTALELGNYLAKDGETQKAVDWQAIFAPGLQLGIPISTSPSHFFVLGVSASYLPRFTSTDGGAVKSAKNIGGFVSFYVPLWDFN